MKKRPKSVRVWDIKEKVKLIAGTTVRSDNGPEYIYFEDLIPYHFKDDPDLPIIQQKMDNIMKLLNAAATNEDPNELNKIWDMDFEDELWYIV